MELGRSRSGWRALAELRGFDAVSRIGSRLGLGPMTSRGLLAVGTSAYEPWHLVAHLRTWSEWRDKSLVAPTLVRWSPPAGAPPHLSVGLDRIAQAGRGETVLVIAPDAAEAGLLNRLADARHRGSTILAVGCAPLAASSIHEVAHDVAMVDDTALDHAQHLLPVAAVGFDSDQSWLGRHRRSIQLSGSRR